jgi:hypothetical protein
MVVAEGKHLEILQVVVLRERTDVARGGRRLPGDRPDRDGPDEQVDDDDQDQADRGQNLARHAVPYCMYLTSQR